MPKRELRFGAQSSGVVRIFQVEPAQPHHSPEDTVDGFVGCVLQYKSSPVAEPKKLGIVLACPNIPRWMSSEYPEVLQEHQAGRLNMDDYSPEWFDKILYLPTAGDGRPSQITEAAKHDAVLKWAHRMNAMATGFDSMLARGCAQVTPASPVFAVRIDTNGDPEMAIKGGTYYTQVTRVLAKDHSVARLITIGPTSERNNFATTADHVSALSRCRGLLSCVDPNGAARQGEIQSILAIRRVFVPPHI